MKENNQKSLVLLVEDDMIDRESVMRIFSKYNVQSEIHFAIDGLDAIERLEEIKDPNFEAPMPTLIILDINLPKVNGLEVLKEIKQCQLTEDIPVVMLTTSEREADKSEALKLGASKYLIKPLCYQDIACFVRER